MAGSAALTGVTALVVARSGDAVDYRRVLEARLASLGARVAQRLGREVTHVVFRRDCGAERAAEDAHLRELFERAARAQARTVVLQVMLTSSLPFAAQGRTVAYYGGRGCLCAGTMVARSRCCARVSAACVPSAFLVCPDGAEVPAACDASMCATYASVPAATRA